MHKTKFIYALELAKIAPSSAKNYNKAIKELTEAYGDNPSIEQLDNFILKKCRKRQAWVKYAIKYYLKFIGREDDYKLLSKAKILLSIRPKNFLPKHKIVEIIDNIENERHKAIANIQFYTGARANEIISINKRRQREEVLPNGNKIYTITIAGKGQKPRTIYLNERLWQSIKPYIEKCRNYPFLEKNNSGMFLGEPISFLSFWTKAETEYHNYLISLKKAAMKCGINPGTHDLRRSFAELIRQETGDIFKVQKALGHSSINTTLKYF